jgi:hypothetical protein
VPRSVPLTIRVGIFAGTITPSFGSPSAATSYPFRRLATGCARLADQLGSIWHHIMPREDVGGRVLL